MALTMEVVAITSVKNEIDIVEAFVRHTLAFVRHLVALDHGSTDGTLDVLRALEKEGLPLSIVEDFSPGKYQSQRMTLLMRDYAVGHYGAEWVLPLDADEFIVVADGGALVREGTPSDRPIALPWLTYVPDAEDDSSQLNPVLRIRRRLVEGCKAVNVLVPGHFAALPGTVILQGNHGLAVGHQRCEPVHQSRAYLAHFPIRSPGQYLAKIAISILQYRTMPGRDANLGAHYREPYELLKRDPHAFAANYVRAAHRYLMPTGTGAGAETVVDPFSYRGGPLVHTPPVNDETRGCLAVLRFADDLAHRYGVLATCMTEDGHAALQRSAEVIAGLRTQLEQQVDQLCSQLIEKERVLQNQNLQLVEKERVLQNQNLQLVEKERVLQEQHVQLSQLTRSMKKSWTWKAGRLVVGPLSMLKQPLSWCSKTFPRLLKLASPSVLTASGLAKPMSETPPFSQTTPENGKAARFTWDSDYYKTIQGWFDFGDIYDLAIQEAGCEANFVEVGAWLGRSTCYMASRIKISGKKIRFWVVDTWKGMSCTQNATLINEVLAKHNGDVFPPFMENMHRGDVADLVHPVQMLSTRAAQSFPDNFFDFIFLDAAHDYASVQEDLRAWWPKLKVGGLFAGHDYSPIWPGVWRAVSEMFAAKVSVTTVGSSFLVRKSTGLLPEYGHASQDRLVA
jgi:Methyltransferase domain/Glycosyl transferase family 2